MAKEISIEQNDKPLCGIVLTGGHSLRMGKDKSLILQHGKPMYKIAEEKLKQTAIRVYISCRSDQAHQFPDSGIIPDSLPSKGPLSGLLSAFATNRECGWLVMPVDMPFITSDFIQTRLIHNRNVNKHATVLQVKGDTFLQPLLAIYEPSCLKHLKRFYSQKIYSLKKILGHLNVNVVQIDGEADLLANFNYPEDWT